MSMYKQIIAICQIYMWSVVEMIYQRQTIGPVAVCCLVCSRSWYWGVLDCWCMLSIEIISSIECASQVWKMSTHFDCNISNSDSNSLNYIYSILVPSTWTKECIIQDAMELGGIICLTCALVRDSELWILLLRVKILTFPMFVSRIPVT